MKLSYIKSTVSFCEHASDNIKSIDFAPKALYYMEMAIGLFL